MKRFSERHQMSTLSELNVTPLLDLAFVLLIIFMITTPLMEKKTDLILPTHKNAPDAVDPEEVQAITVDQNALVSLNGATVERDGLGTALAALKEAHPGLAVVIRAHKDLTVQKLTDLMDALKQAGITKVGWVGTEAE